MTPLREIVEWVAADLATADPALADSVDRLRRRLRGPLRVALIGPAKAGKSTLLNALVGERLAATAAEELTRLVTTYAYADVYQVRGVMPDGSRRDLPFSRERGLVIQDWGDLPVTRVEVGWPATGLRSMTLIDTPGLDSIIVDQEDRTAELLDGDDAVDAAIVLMRRLHAGDAEFLESFGAGAVGTRVNAIAVLSRADEVGGCAPDAIERAARIAARYEAEPRVAARCAAVVGVSGILGEAAALLTETDYASLAEVAARPDAPDVVLTADRFAAASDAGAALLRRLGMFGVRLALDAIRSGEVHGAADLADRCADLSGVDRLRTVLNDHVAARADLLRARAALRRLRGLAQKSAGGADALRRLEAAEARAPELVAFRLESLILAGDAELSDDEVAEAVAIAADLATGEADRDVLVGAVERWRTAAAHPLASLPTAEARELVARLYETRISALGST